MKNNYSISKLIVAFSFATFFCVTLATAQSNIGGVISSDTTLTLANSPYIVTNNLLVAQNVKVTVEPGVHLLFDQGIYLQVDGELHAVGTDDSIWFTKNTASGTAMWGGMFFSDISVDYNTSDGTGCILDRCIVEYAQDNHDEMIRLANCSPKISNSIIRNGGPFIALLGDGPETPIILNNTIYNTGQALAFPSTKWALIQGNEIFNCSWSLGDPAVVIGRVLFKDNYVHDCSNDNVVMVQDTSVIVNNTFEDNPNNAVNINSGDLHIVKCNSFSNNGTNLVINCERHPLVINNNFNNYINWNVYWVFDQGVWDCHVPYGSGVYATIDLSNNYWGGLSNAQMDASIWDFNDDFSLKALINYSPVLPDTVSVPSSDCSYPLSADYLPNTDDNKVEIYPNPFHDVSYLKIKNILLNQTYSVVILDTYGRIVRTLAVKNPERIEIDRNDLPAGLYAFQITSPEKKFYSGKFIIQ